MNLVKAQSEMTLLADTIREGEIPLRIVGLCTYLADINNDLIRFFLGEDW